MAENTKTVWVVEQGDYSDRHTVGVFSSQERADAYVAAFKGDHDVTEYVLDEETTPPGMRPFSVRLVEAGGERFPFEPGADASWMSKPPRDGWICPTSGIHKWDGATPLPSEVELKDLTVECWARDEEHAIKIASERRASYLANVRRST